MNNPASKSQNAKKPTPSKNDTAPIPQTNSCSETELLCRKLGVKYDSGTENETSRQRADRKRKNMQRISNSKRK